LHQVAVILLLEQMSEVLEAEIENFIMLCNGCGCLWLH